MANREKWGKLLSDRLPSNVRTSAKDYLGIALGTLLTALALDAFLVPGQLAAGGASGLAIDDLLPRYRAVGPSDPRSAFRPWS